MPLQVDILRAPNRDADGIVRYDLVHLQKGENMEDPEEQVTERNRI